MRHIYVDDYRACPAGFLLARNAEEAILLIANMEVDILSLDFDLGYDQPTGLAIVHFMTEHSVYPQEVYLHTSSEAGRMQMYRLLSQHAPSHVELHYGPMPDEVRERVARQASGS
ncbi:cyclic-phosphate processing receiver domain-containing protein [Paenibacillus sp. MMS18-CY102]|uniref:cyclic-phosphate processing receiver domain-containing protein n=1 Tax=Paenibacillus sp. MMS18-CY102 TaxID=2682849 RepID=UPI00136588C1|nr:cyclic-phosphate processing receiver domain-containing protein [Paenibacillus sp. MMS18-CY102]MWC28192.1 cell division protein FtsJ [Paenibacillus sp. MMS18-CY102]